MSGHWAVVWFGERVRRLRDERNWSVQDLAEASGLAVKELEGIEDATVSASLNALRALAGSFGLLLSELFEGLELLDQGPKFGVRIQLLRRERDWGEAELAEASGLAVEEIAAIEDDELSPTMESIRALAVALELSLVELLDGGRGWAAKE